MSLLNTGSLAPMDNTDLKKEKSEPIIMGENPIITLAKKYWWIILIAIAILIYFLFIK